MTRSVLVTGGAGFVGVRLTERLLARDVSVTVLDDFSATTPQRLSAFDGHPHLKITRVDLRDPVLTTSTIQSIKPDAVIHLAARHFIPFCVANPAETLAVNVVGTQNLLDAIAALDEITFVFASTADVYKPDLAPHTELSSTAPDNVYGASKLLGEQLVRIFAAQNEGAQVSIARLFNVIGPGETNPHLLPEILRQAAISDEIHLGNITTRRDFVYVDDVAAALDHLTESPAGLNAVNVGSGQSWTAKEIAEETSRILGRKLIINTDATRIRPSDRPNLQADTTRRDSVFSGMHWTALADALAPAVSSHATDVAAQPTVH